LDTLTAPIEVDAPAERSEPDMARWMGWRLRLLVAAVLAGCIALLGLGAWVSNQPQLQIRWQHGADWGISVAGAPGTPSRLVAIESDGLRLVPPPGMALLQASSRWTPSDDARRTVQVWHRNLHAALRTPGAVWVLDDGRRLPVDAGTGPHWPPQTFWLLAAAALALYVVGLVVALATPQARTLMFALIALCQGGNLLAIAVEQALQWGYPPEWSTLESPVRCGFDLLTAAAIVQTACLHPRRLPASSWLPSLAWTTAVLMTMAALVAAAVSQAPLPGGWWWVQTCVALMGLAAICLLTWSHRTEAHPLATQLRRIGVLMLAGWLLLTIGLALGHASRGAHTGWMDLAVLAWTVFLVGLLLITPFMARSPAAVREFALVAGVSTFAAAVDLMLVALFSFGRITSLSVTLFLSLGLYAGARHWLLGRLLGQQPLSTGRMFEMLLRTAREIELKPERGPAAMLALMKDLFEPIECSIRPSPHTGPARVVADGSTLLLSVPPAFAAAGEATPALVLRFAQRGRRLFTPADARLADSVAEQLRRAAAFGHAVEQGRNEERLRLAQDLHDDIGARLLTLMYQAPTPEVEDYVRHTLQDLKTLTRGLAASTHWLSHAAAEWKADLTHRLDASSIQLEWEFEQDRDIQLSVVQWSALTRVLRELASNVIAHAQARRLAATMRLSSDTLELTVADDGIGQDPDRWAHGLGLGGVRKRVRQLGGDVEWQALAPNGIRCQVRIPGFVKPGHGD
jgi:signal transduction histidine kinase